MQVRVQSPGFALASSPPDHPAPSPSLPFLLLLPVSARRFFFFFFFFYASLRHPPPTAASLTESPTCSTSLPASPPTTTLLCVSALGLPRCYYHYYYRRSLSLNYTINARRNLVTTRFSFYYGRSDYSSINNGPDLYNFTCTRTGLLS